MPEADRRPLPVQLFNIVGRLGKGVTKLNPDQLIRKARRNTGLHDLGEDFPDTALLTLIRSINEEADLHPFGRLMAKEKLVSQLENRLWAEHWFNQYPEILEQNVLPIILITGLQRTGTTKMQRLLSSLPGARPLPAWEALYPAPLGKEDEQKKRIARTRRNERAVKWLSPSFHAIHPIYHDQPEEDVLLLDLQFMSSSSEAIMNVPGFATWLDQQDPEVAYQYERKLLKLLQWQRKDSYWVLKSPHHLEYLDAFTRVFPDTRVIWMHREPTECVPSFLNMLFHSRSLFTDHADENRIKSQWLPKLVRMVRNGLAFRKKSDLAVQDVLFKDLIQDENAVLETIRPVLPADTASFTYNRSQNSTYKSRHRYSLEDWDLNPGTLEEDFSQYQLFLNSINGNNE